jgi:hypothetical protein
VHESSGTVSLVGREHGLVFNRVAEDYEQARPGYPAVLVDAACAAGGLQPTRASSKSGVGRAN